MNWILMYCKVLPGLGGEEEWEICQTGHKCQHLPTVLCKGMYSLFLIKVYTLSYLKKV